MIRFVERKWWYFGLSLLLIVPGVIFLALGGLKPGIEFKGGTLLDARFDTPPTIAEVRTVMSDLKHDEAIIQVAEGGRIEIRTFEMKPDEIVAAEAAIKDKFGANVKDISHEVVSPSFSGELIDNAVRSIALASVMIVLLIALPSATSAGRRSATGSRPSSRSFMTPRSFSGCSRSWVTSSTSRSTACS